MLTAAAVRNIYTQMMLEMRNIQYLRSKEKGNGQ